MPDTVKVLFLSANPSEEDVLRTDRELREILRAVRAAPTGLPLEVVSESAVEPGDLQGAILRHDPQVVHFAGHGDGSDGLTFDDARAVGVDALVGLFAALEGRVRAVVLNACRTDLIAEALSRSVDYAVGMGEPIGDAAAAAFAGAFYGALACGIGIPTAFDLGVSQVAIHACPHGGMPVLRIRPGNHPGPLVPRPSRGHPVAPAPTRAARAPQRIRIGNASLGSVRFNGPAAGGGGQDIGIDRLRAEDAEFNAEGKPRNDGAT